MKRSILQISLLTLLILGVQIAGPIQPEWPAFAPVYPSDPPFQDAGHPWVDSIMEGMSLEERIGQMIMIQAYSNMGESHRKNILRTLSRHHVGGIAFFQGDPLNQASLTNEYQSAADVPLLIAMDGETGLGMRLERTITYPTQMTLGAIEDESLLYELGQDMAAQMRRLGVHMNFAPVADVNNNPSNPVINTRSFGEDPVNVAAKVISLMHGMQDGGVLAAAKHFPGHGDTDTDSHYSLPLLPFPRERLDSVELHPFREAIQRGLGAVMVAHLQVPELEDREQRPATVSHAIIHDLLKEELGFKGLIVTDALNMKGLSQYLEPGRREVEAVKAGNDILLMPADAGLAISEIRKAVRKGEIPEERIDQSCRKILRAKYWAGLAHHRPVDPEGLIEDLNHREYGVLHRALVEHAITLARNRDSILPLRNLQRIKLATVTISRDGSETGGTTSDLYLKADHYAMSSGAGTAEIHTLLDKLEGYTHILVHVRNTSSFASRKFGITEACITFIESLPPSSRILLNIAGYPYAVTRFKNLDHVDALIFSYSDDPMYQVTAIQGIFGGRGLHGKLPVAAGTIAGAGMGIQTGRAVRLGYGEPMDEGLDPDTLLLMEDIVAEAIREKAIPGCQILVARNGRVVWNRSYGYHTYRKRDPVSNGDIYDLASITKIAATLPSLMRLRDLGRIHEDSLLGSLLSLPDTCNKDSLRIADILAHQSGLIPWIPFYQYTLEPLDTSKRLVSTRLTSTYSLQIGPSDYANRNVKYVDSVYARTYSPEYPIRIADGLFMRTAWRDSLYQQIYDSPLGDTVYRYSDLGFFLFQQLIEEQTDTLLYPYAWYNFYAPLGAETLGYLPLNRFPAERIVPTENDLFYRRQLLRGHVHDMGAAMLGGVSGHAGLFGSANDLAKLMQMYLNGGWYGKRRFISDATLQRFAACYNCENDNRRGLGFDRPLFDEEEQGPACDSASARSFGHSGFTGTLTWVDPEYDLLYVFLSNRIHPNQGNTLLIDENYRTRIQQVIYNALLD